MPPESAAPSDVPPGTILRATDDKLFVATGQGMLAIRRLQPAGKRVMETAEFLRGHALTEGTRLE